MKSKVLIFILSSLSLSLLLLKKSKALKKEINTFPIFKLTIKRLDSNIKKMKKEIEGALAI